jgi:hypothetical protein
LGSSLVNNWLRKVSIGNLRFRLPQPIRAYSGVQEATSFGPACPQQAIRLPLPRGFPNDALNFVTNSVFSHLIPDDEDCECLSGTIYAYMLIFRFNYQCCEACICNLRSWAPCCGGKLTHRNKEEELHMTVLHSGYLEVGSSLVSARQPNLFQGGFELGSPSV